MLPQSGINRRESCLTHYKYSPKDLFRISSIFGENWKKNSFLRKFHILVLDTKLKYGLTRASTQMMTTSWLSNWLYDEAFFIFRIFFCYGGRGTVDIDIDLSIIDDGEADCRHCSCINLSLKSANPLIRLRYHHWPPRDLCTWAKL